jgi:hypothetical protein
MIVGQIAAGHGIAQILADYPHLEREDVREHEDLSRRRSANGSETASAALPTLYPNSARLRLLRLGRAN